VKAVQCTWDERKELKAESRDEGKGSKAVIRGSGIGAKGCE
jgi:hypothetical protein